MAHPQPFGPILHRQSRGIRPIPPHILAKIANDDEQFNAIRQRVITRSRLERATTTAAIWLCVGAIGYFAVQYLRLVLA